MVDKAQVDTLLYCRMCDVVSENLIKRFNLT